MQDNYTASNWKIISEKLALPSKSVWQKWGGRKCIASGWASFSPARIHFSPFNSLSSGGVCELFPPVHLNSQDTRQEIVYFPKYKSSFSLTLPPDTKDILYRKAEDQVFSSKG